MLRWLGFYLASNLMSVRGMFRAHPAPMTLAAGGGLLSLAVIGVVPRWVLDDFEPDLLSTPPEDALALLVLVTLFCGLIMSLLTVTVALFERRQIEELDRLRALPLRPDVLFMFKLLDQSATVVIGLFLVYPFLRWIAESAGLGLPGLLVLLAGFGLILLQVVLGLFGGVVLCVELLPERLVRLRYLLSGAVMLGILLVALAISQEGQLMEASLRPFLHVTWMRELLHGLQARSIRLILRGGLSLAASTLALGVIARWIYTELFLERFESLLAKLHQAGAGYVEPDRTTGIASALLLKEWRLVSRDRAYALVCALIMAVLVLPFLPLSTLSAEPVVVLGLSCYWALVGLIGTNLLALLALSSVGREGVGMGQLGWLPVSTRRSLVMRILFYAGLMCVIGGAWLGVMGAMAGSPSAWGELAWCGMLTIAGVSFWSALSWLAVTVGAVFARPETKNPYRRVSILGLGIFLSFEILLLVTFVCCVLCAVLLPGAFPAVVGLVALVWGVVGGLLLREAERVSRQRIEGRAA